jgi:hypothetical protein
MNDLELDRLLKSAPVPQKPEEYWRQFPGRVMAKIHWRQAGTGANRNADIQVSPTRSRLHLLLSTRAFLSKVRLPALGLALVAVGILVGVAFGLWQGRRVPLEVQQLGQARKYFHEITGLFPNQVQAIVFDEQGAHLVLAEQPDVPVSTPLYVRICGPNGCTSFVTFSGQQIRVNGDVFEVLTDRRGDVLLVGRQSVWSSDQAQARSGPYRIEAKPLEAAS